MCAIAPREQGEGCIWGKPSLFVTAFQRFMLTTFHMLEGDKGDPGILNSVSMQHLQACLLGVYTGMLMLVKMTLLEYTAVPLLSLAPGRASTRG